MVEQLVETLLSDTHTINNNTVKNLSA
uniref:Uncharacterized protein n=1 Tax=Anguilla anguilla TaxID=7936 RepID=A0A0E9RJM1_ANGAN